MGSLVHMKEATVITPSDQTSSSVMSLSALDSQLFLCFTIEYLLVYPPVSDLRTGGALAQSRRGFLVELGTREKALLAEDAASRRFMSHKKGCCYEIYARAVMREDEAQDVEGSSSVSLSPSLTI